MDWLKEVKATKTAENAEIVADSAGIWILSE